MHSIWPAVKEAQFSKHFASVSPCAPPADDEFCTSNINHTACHGQTMWLAMHGTSEFVQAGSMIQGCQQGSTASVLGMSDFFALNVYQLTRWLAESTLTYPLTLVGRRTDNNAILIGGSAAATVAYLRPSCSPHSTRLLQAP